ncbi:S49 family peptidase [Microvirga brassicacearum]|uniref:S49 family peptidase n=1 Tax=Microvirga brassicacearum TaxID=2580413 RepID=A0A5N3PH66_9HYPH|nr:S49 family peptidase [Microvirga brassicacearum]KAB0269058.1 S49 family peptidase [Microvirga brassicacearum]
MPTYDLILRKAFNKPLWLLPSAAETIGAFLLDRARGDQVARPMSGRLDAEPVRGRNGTMYRRQGSAAIITVEGELVNRGAWVGADSGLTSYEGVASQLKEAARDASVQTIVLDMESPGGEAVGAMEIASLVRKVNADKRVVAVVDGMAASAGYAIASGADEIITVPSGIVGSIGVVMLHIDQSQALADRGIKPTLIFAGAHKVDGHSFAALPENVRADFQSEIEQFYSLFVQTVAEGRRGMSAKAVRATEARTYIGQEAVKVGLADAVGTLDDVLAGIAARGNGRKSYSKAKGSLKMDIEEKNAAAIASLAAVVDKQIASATAIQPAPAAATLDTGAIAAQAAADAKARIGAILQSDEAKGRETQANHIAFQTDMSVDDAKKMLAASAIAAPAASEQSYVERKAEGGTLGFHESTPDTKAVASAGWGKATKAANRQFEDNPT